MARTPTPPPGPQIPVGDPVTWTYGSPTPATCRSQTSPSPTTRPVSTRRSRAATPMATIAWTQARPGPIEATGTASAGQYENTGRVTGTDQLENPLSDTDPSHYFGARRPSSTSRSRPTGSTPTSAPGPRSPSATRHLDLRGHQPRQRADRRRRGRRRPGRGQSRPSSAATTTPTACSTPARPGPSRPPGRRPRASTRTPAPSPAPTRRASGSAPPTPPTTSASRSAIDIEKSTNGADADDPTGPLIAVGDPVTWTYVVTNPGNVPIADVAVTDDQAGVDPAFQSGDDGRRRRCSTPRRPGPMRPPGPRPRASTRTSARSPAPTRSAPGSPTPTPRTTSAPRSAIDIEKSTNGADADDPPGPFIPVTDQNGDPTLITWTYRVTNTGNARLTGLEVTDDHAGVSVSCPVDSLAPGRSTTCTATADAERGQYANLGTATATDPLGTEVTDSDPSHYRGVLPGIDVEKSTNGADADNVPGPLVPVGDPVVWTYVVTNTGDDPLTDVVVTDDQGVAGQLPADHPRARRLDDLHRPRRHRRARSIREPGHRHRHGHRRRTVRDSDPSHYFGEDPSIDIEKSTNGARRRRRARAPDPRRRPGLLDLRDHQHRQRAAALVGVRRPGRGAGLSAGSCSIFPGQTVFCRAGGSGAGRPIREPRHRDRHQPDGRRGLRHRPLPLLRRPRRARHREVHQRDRRRRRPRAPDPRRRPGHLDLRGHQPRQRADRRRRGRRRPGRGQTRPSSGGDDDSDGLLDPGETWTFEATGTATAGQYENTGTATGTDPQGLGLSATDPSHYFGVASAIDIEKSTNGADADDPPGPLITVGDPVTWTYVVTNPGNAPIADVAVTDDQAGVDPAFQSGDPTATAARPPRPGP